MSWVQIPPPLPFFRRRFCCRMPSMPLKDPAKRREYHRSYMRNRLNVDPEFKRKHLARVKKNTLRYRTTAASVILDFKRNGCLLCGESDPCCVSAHHVKPEEKSFDIGELQSGGHSPDTISAELKKCVPLCENCHRKVHAGRISLPAQ